MPRKKFPGKKKAQHRPLIPIDWKLVEQMILAGCPGTEIAGALGVCTDTFYDRFKIEKGVCFSEYAPSRKSGGAGMIRTKQFQSAMRGSNQMLKILGEEWLGQGKKDDLDTTATRDLIHLYQKLEKIESALFPGRTGQPTFSIEQSLPYQGCTGEENQIRNELGPTNIMEGETQL